MSKTEDPGKDRPTFTVQNISRNVSELEEMMAILETRMKFFSSCGMKYHVQHYVGCIGHLQVLITNFGNFDALAPDMAIEDLK